MAGCKTPGPLCQNSNPVDVDEGTSTRHQSPVPGAVGIGRHIPFCAAVPVKTVVYDQDTILTLLTSVAQAKVAERHTKLIWKPYNESTVINIIYKILPYEKPGTVELELGSTQELSAETEAETDRLLEAFVSMLSQGAGRTARFLEAQEKIRAGCLQTVQAVYREASEINEAVEREARRAIARLTLIKAASTITLKATALAVSGAPAFLVGTGYDLSLNVIKDWDQAPDAKLVGVATKLGDKVAKKAAKDAAKNMAYVFKKEAEGPSHKAAWLQKRLAAMEEQLHHQANAERLRKFAKDTRRLRRAQEEAAHARNWAKALSSVKYVFFAWDVYKAAQDASDTFQSAGYARSLDAIKDAFSY